MPPCDTFCALCETCARHPLPPPLLQPPLPKSVKDLIRRLLKINKSKRLGKTAGGARAVMKHKWFSGFDWEGLLKKQLEVPIKPNVREAGEGGEGGGGGRWRFSYCTGWSPCFFRRDYVALGKMHDICFFREQAAKFVRRGVLRLIDVFRIHQTVTGGACLKSNMTVRIEDTPPFFNHKLFYNNHSPLMNRRRRRRPTGLPRYTTVFTFVWFAMLIGRCTPRKLIGQHGITVSVGEREY